METVKKYNYGVVACSEGEGQVCTKVSTVEETEENKPSDENFFVSHFAYMATLNPNP
jgi:hypothetical protein